MARGRSLDPGMSKQADSWDGGEALHQRRSRGLVGRGEVWLLLGWPPRDLAQWECAEWG